MSRNSRSSRRVFLNTGYRFRHSSGETTAHLKFWTGISVVECLERCKKEGDSIPPVPVVYVDAKDAKEAKEKVLLDVVAVRQMSDLDVYEFIQSAERQSDDMKDVLALPQFDLQISLSGVILPTR